MNCFLNLLVRNVIEREIKRKKVQMNLPIEFVFVFADRDVQKLFLVPRQNLQFLFRVASLFVVLCMYVSSHVVCADLVCIL